MYRRFCGNGAPHSRFADDLTLTQLNQEHTRSEASIDRPVDPGR